MIIQVWHSRNSDYQKELYEPIKNSQIFKQYTWIFPHDWFEDVNSKVTLKNVDIFIAEVSESATWLGIELWFASVYGKKILCLSKKWVKISSSLSRITKNFIEYNDSHDMIKKIAMFLNTL